MDDILLTWYQAMQLLALGPCLFMVFFLCVSGKKSSQLIVPVLYFISLASSFFLPLIDIMTAKTEIRGVLLITESLTPALSFLLIIQFITGKVPPLLYWSIFALPLLGGSSIIYATLVAKGEVCIYDQICTVPVMFKQLYDIFSGAFIFLLTITIYARTAQQKDETTHQQQNKYALVMALIILNLALLSITLAQISGHVPADKAALAITIVRSGFIYLVLTSVFRVFDRSFEIAYERIPHIRPDTPSVRDLMLADEIRTLLTRDKIHRDMEMSRGKLAAKLAITEHTLSRIINQCFEQNFSSLLNQYRVLEAKERLEKEDTAITIIAFEVGFSSIPSFNRVFKMTTGMSPSEYRNSMQAAKN